MKREINTYTKEDIDRVLAATNNGETGAMHRALVITILETGLRCSEAISLTPADVDLELGRLVVHHGKGDKRRVLGLSVRAKEALAGWMRIRYLLLGRAPRSPIFTTTGKKLCASAIRQIFQRLNKRSGLEKRFHPHGLRHTFADKMARRADVPIRHIQHMLGHSSLSTTDIYLRHLCPDDVVQLMKES